MEKDTDTYDEILSRAEEDAGLDASYWDGLFEMAESFMEAEDSQICDNVHFLVNESKKNEKFNSSEEALKALFGYDSFRPGQKAVIDSILKGRDVLAVMPTGAGKSICYQIPATMLSGITVVVSPLISLMQDQVKALNEAGVPAAFINSSLSESTFFETIDNAQQGLYKILYVAPERLVTERFLKLAQNVDISMVTVDEAHCISQWGQDFRPSYMKIVEFVNFLEKRPVISAFTATATENVRDDIVCTLGLNDPYVPVQGFDRKNLFFRVDKPKDKDKFILDYVSSHPEDSGIIYCSTRKNTDSLYELLNNNSIPAAKYHAGMSAQDRKKMQDDFVFDYKGIVVATNAFGMGIDKSNVRFVIHYNMPQSMENYYQEAGRAGRDGLDSECILLFSPQDIIINRFLIEHREKSDLEPQDKENILARDEKRLQVMVDYCYTTECLRNFILKYFGEHPDKPCESCGNCLTEFETIDMTEAAKKIINCVYEARGRYGRNIIIDTVSGANTKRLKETGTIKYKSYGVLSSVSKDILKRLVEQMISEKYLTVGDYQVIELGDISMLKNPETTVMLKITDYDRQIKNDPKPEKKTRVTDLLTAAGYKLFDEYRKLRFEIARKESLPPYIIFSDKTLTDMAVKVPLSKEEMLNVSGVGENKYAKYGEKFLSVTEKYAEKYPELLESKREAANITPDNAEKQKKKAKKKDYYLLKEESENFEYAEYMYVSEIKDEMNRICLREDVKKLPVRRLSEILISEGYIVESDNDGFVTKAPTEKGLEHGIKVIEKVSERGMAYNLLMYPENIQRFLMEHFILCSPDENPD